MSRNNILAHLAIALVLVLIAAFAGQIHKWQKGGKPAKQQRGARPRGAGGETGGETGGRRRDSGGPDQKSSEREVRREVAWEVPRGPSRCPTTPGGFPWHRYCDP